MVRKESFSPSDICICVRFDKYSTINRSWGGSDGREKKGVKYTTASDNLITTHACTFPLSLHKVPPPASLVPRPSELISAGAERTAWEPLFAHAQRFSSK